MFVTMERRKSVGAYSDNSDTTSRACELYAQPCGDPLPLRPPRHHSPLRSHPPPPPPHASLASRFSSYTGFHVATISDGLPDDHPRSGSRAVDIVQSLGEVGGPQFRRLMVSTDTMSDGGAWPRVSCLIMDGMLSFPIPVAEEMEIPFMYFPTISACGLWPYFCIQEIIKAERREGAEFDLVGGVNGHGICATRWKSTAGLGWLDTTKEKSSSEVAIVRERESPAVYRETGMEAEERGKMILDDGGRKCLSVSKNECLRFTIIVSTK
ncbi:hypothetical protein SASPL_147634 [Salvia splendens]|uniref:Uncharacterized protein n=1 Tax=Salvia splendens TaxID=180675 RepID=A0A8X8WFK3_SALSN|nr:hypothetical protein SASPL_147634 [Salvia splendens]